MRCHANSKFDCLVHEMLLIKQLTPSLNVQSDSIRAKLFTNTNVYIHDTKQSTDVNDVVPERTKEV